MTLRTVCVFAAAAVLGGRRPARRRRPRRRRIPANVDAAADAGPRRGAATAATTRVTPPPPTEVYSGSWTTPQITIIRKETETVEEIRVNGDLRYVRVTPKGGKPYYLVPSSNGKSFIRYDSLGSDLERADVAVVFLVT